MNHRHPKPEQMMAGRGLCAAIIWGICFLGSSPAVMSDTAGNGAMSSSSVETLALVSLAELGPIISDSAEASDSTGGDHAKNSPEAGQKGLAYHPVPEPQTWVIAVSGLATLMVLQRLRRRHGVRKL
jgi:hypothetical protein